MVDGLAVLQKVHGIVGALAVASCLHPVLTVRTHKVPGPRIRLSAWLSAAVMSLAFGMALWLYPDYRLSIKPWLLANHPELHTVWFEIKEATGYLVLAAAWGGAALLHFGRREQGARTAGKALFTMAFAGGLATAVIGIVVSSVKDF